MTALSRRTLLASSAAALAATSAPTYTARAAAPITGQQGAGIYRYKIGSFEITAINDGTWYRALDDKFVKNAPFADVQKALSDQFLPTDKIPIPFTTLMVNTGSKLILLDTGTGGQLAPTAGTMAANMAAAGIDPKAVDTIIISHFHPDHINGIKTKDGAKVFPNAEINVPAPEWAHWMDDAKMNAAPEAARGAFLNARRVFGDIANDVKRFEPGKEVAPGHHLDRRARPHAGPYGVCDRVRQPVDALHRRYHQQSVAVRAQSGMAGGLRRRRQHGGRDAQEAARPRRRRQDDRARLSLPLPGLRLHHQDREGLRSHSGDVAAGADLTPCCAEMTKGRSMSGPLHFVTRSRRP